MSRPVVETSILLDEAMPSPPQAQKKTFFSGLLSGVALTFLLSLLVYAAYSPVRAGEVPGSMVAMPTTSLALASGPYEEKTTGVIFEPTVSKGGATMQLLGAGPRIKKVVVITVKVYAVGLYVEPAAAVKALKAAGISSASKAAPSLYDALKKGAFSKCIKIVMTYGVSRDTLVEALADVVAAKIKETAGPSDVREYTALFSSIFDDDKEFKKGDVIELWSVANKFQVSVNGDQRSPIVGKPVLAQAFFSIYLDKDTPAPKARDHFVDRIPELGW